MADDKMTPAEASNVLEALRVLEKLEAAGTIRPAEQKALDTYRAKRKTAEREQVETASTYRGALQGATMSSADEIAGLLSMVTGGGYAEGRDTARQRNEAAQMLAPNEYASGQAAGGIGSALIPIGGTQALAAKAGAGLLTRMGIGAATGGALAALPQFMGGEGGFGERLSEVSPWAAGIGAGLGAIGPAVGAAGGSIVRGLQNMKRGIPPGGAFPGASALATQSAAKAVGATERGGQDIRAYLAQIGDDGMLADVPGPLQSRAQGLATIGGEGGTTLGRAIEGRAATAPRRIEAVVDAVAGQPTAAFKGRVAREAERKTVLGPEYEAALQYPDPITVKGMAKDILAMGKDATAGVRGKLATVVKELSSRTGKISATKLHNIRVDLADAINVATRAGEGGLVNKLMPVLAKIDEQLDLIPGYKAARTGYANNMAMERAAEAGKKAFAGGAVASMSPEDMALGFARLSPAEQDAFRTGAREYIAALMGTARNAPAAAWGDLAKGFNDKKLRILFGDAEAEKILTTLRGENVFSQTRGKVLSGSETARRTEAAADLADIRDPTTFKRPGPIVRAWSGLDEAGNAVLDSILYGPRRNTANRDLGMILSLRGKERDRVLAVLMREAAEQNKNTTAQKAARELLELIARTGAAVQVQEAQ